MSHTIHDIRVAVVILLIIATLTVLYLPMRLYIFLERKIRCTDS